MTEDCGSLIWTGGSIQKRESFAIDPFDEGLLYGRGLFETTRTVNHAPWLWDAHLERMIASSGPLAIPVDRDRLPAAEQVTEFVKSIGCGDVVVRLNASAGVKEKPGQVWMIARPLRQPRGPMRLQTSPIRISPSDPFAAHKCFNYGVRHLAHTSALAAGFDSALLLDCWGNVLEGAYANVFVRFGRGWVTPPLTGGVLPGTVRALLLARHPALFREEVLQYEQLAQAQSVMMTNSGQGAVCVKAIDSMTYSGDCFDFPLNLV